MVQSFAPHYVPADVLTTHNYIFGQLSVPYSGLMGMLSDTTSSYLEINDASVAMIHKPDKVLNYAPVIWMVKGQVVAVCLAKYEYAGLQAVLRGGYARMQPYQVQITTSTYNISGTFEWAGRFEFPALMSEGTNAFFVLTDAVVTAPLYPALHLEVPIALINRLFLETFIITKKGAEN